MFQVSVPSMLIATCAHRRTDTGVRNYCGIDFPDGLLKNQKLAENVVTPTTKADYGDAPMAPADMVKEKYITQEDYDYCAKAALAIFKLGQEEAAKRGLILVDTKYEFGRASDGKIYLIDEVRSWPNLRVLCDALQQCPAADADKGSSHPTGTATGPHTR
jgi:phosphoribosylaminoimidazole-succinocarboxamide synthase